MSVVNLSTWLMEPNRAWNRLGPKLPAWFRLRLRRIDPQLALQFMPPREVDADGLDPVQYPEGAWVVCRRMRGTRWLVKRWVVALTDNYGRYCEPGLDMCAMIRMARDLWRQNRMDVLEDVLDTSIQRLRSARVAESRKMLAERIQRACRTYDLCGGTGNVFFPESAIAKAN